jgi:hypothetical protein
MIYVVLYNRSIFRPGPAARKHFRGGDTDLRKFIFDGVIDTLDIHLIAISP